MNETDISVYLMNPAEDRIIFGDELAEGMWVLPEDLTVRRPFGHFEDEQLLRQRFRRVTRMRREGHLVVFIGEWVNGFQQVHRYSVDYGWIVKKEAPIEPEV